MVGRNGRKSSETSNFFSQPDEEKGSIGLLDSTANQRRPAGWRAVSFILANETFERLASFGLMANFMVYLQREYNMNSVQAAIILNGWSGASNFAPVIGAYVSDAYIGKFWTIVWGSFAAILGMVILTLTAMLPQLRPPPCALEEQQGQCIGYNGTQLGVLIVSLCLLSIGNGGIKPCSIPFSVDQFDLTTEEGRKGNNSFYNLYYTTQTIVLLITQTVVVYIQNDVSWTFGFGLPTICMAFAIVLFFIGTKFYVYIKPEGSVFGGVAQVFVAAYKKRRLYLPADDRADGQFHDPPLKRSLLRPLHLTRQYRCLNKAALVMDDEVKTDGFCVNPWRLCSVQQVEDVKCLLNIIPIWLASILGFLAMNQQTTFTVAQALKMDLNLGYNIEIPAGSVSAITLIAIAIWLPFYDRILVPKLERVTKVEGGITLLQRIGIGNIFSILTMLVSGFIETKRRQSALSHSGGSDGVAPMSVIWLTPQLILIGFSEIFSIIGLIEFCNKQFPDHMRSIGNSLIYLTFSLASYASSSVISIVNDVTGKQGASWLSDDINESKLDDFYFLIAGISLLNFVFFMFCARRYHYKGSITLSE